eukprot:3535146-Pyramimonas_sp.AAC.1
MMPDWNVWGDGLGSWPRTHTDPSKLPKLPKHGPSPKHLPHTIVAEAVPTCNPSCMIVGKFVDTDEKQLVLSHALLVPVGFDFAEPRGVTRAQTGDVPSHVGLRVGP